MSSNIVLLRNFDFPTEKKIIFQLGTFDFPTGFIRKYGFVKDFHWHAMSGER